MTEDKRLTAVGEVETNPFENEETFAIEKALNEGTSVEIIRQPRVAHIEVAGDEDDEDADEG